MASECLRGLTSLSPTWVNIRPFRDSYLAGDACGCPRTIMTSDDEFDAMVDACREAHEAVMEHGTPEMQAFAKALLHALAKEAAGRARSGENGHDGG